jgi:hypothetical protein
MSTFRLKRVAFMTSRLSEFCGQRELVAQTGHAIEDWPLESCLGKVAGMRSKSPARSELFDGGAA